ncbi:MAG: FIST C-terminal domain-containing protein [Deltaproteobacteria bacterium]|jgi:hypothetical protein|nr:FIST C-terminal domain-containing protein [Deltaproteobacteria bacterium]
MLKMLTACTREIDDAAAAAKEILAQLDLKNSLLKNAVGILTCHAYFLPEGVVKAVCDKLPFDIIGTTTLGAGTDKGTDLEILTLSVLTSDDVKFAAVLTDSLQTEQEAPVRVACGSAKAALGSSAGTAPSLVLAYAPLLQHVGGERLVRIVNRVIDGAPLFGTLTCDHNFDFRDSQVIFNGQAYRDRLALVFLSGPVNCRFLTVSVPERYAEKQNAIITESEVNVVKKVNGVPVLEYLKTLGFTRENGLEGSKSIPVILDYNDGTPAVARCFYMISDEGNAVCGGEMPTGATFALSSMDADDVLLSAEQALDKAASLGECNGMLIIPCIVRSVTLGVDQLSEARRVAGKLGGKAPYQLCYSGGEICPVYQPDGKTVNRFHNFSFAVCLFQ